jgi:hypothetical protein
MDLAKVTRSLGGFAKLPAFPALLTLVGLDDLVATYGRWNICMARTRVHRQDVCASPGAQGLMSESQIAVLTEALSAVRDDMRAMRTDYSQLKDALNLIQLEMAANRATQSANARIGEIIKWFIGLIVGGALALWGHINTSKH